MSNEEVIHSILIEGLDDWVPVDNLVVAVEDSVGDSPELRVRTFSEVLSHMLDFGLLEVGDLMESGFVSRGGSTRGIVTRVVQELDALDWNPQGGSCWLSNTKSGDELAMKEDRHGQEFRR